MVKKFYRILFLSVLVGCRHSERNTKEVVVIAAVLPISGEHGHIGRNIANAMALATLNRKVNVLFFDSENLQETDIKNVAECDMIIGPVDSASSKALYQQINGKVPIISLSNDIDISGENLLVAGYSPLQEMLFLMNYARQCAYDKYIVFVPEGAYGEIMLEACKRCFKTEDLRIIKYDFISHDVIKQYIQEQDKRYCVILPEINALPPESIENVTFFMKDDSNATAHRTDVVCAYNRKPNINGVAIASFFAEVYGYAASELDLLAYDVMRYVLLRKAGHKNMENPAEDWYPAQTGSFKIGKSFEREWVIQYRMPDGGKVDVSIAKETEIPDKSGALEATKVEQDEHTISYSENVEDTIINDITEEYHNGNNTKADAAA